MAKVKAKSNKKREKRSRVIIHIYAGFGNTIVTITDTKGNGLGQSSAGAAGFKGSRKRTPYAAQVASNNICKKVKDEYEAAYCDIRVRGAGPGRESAIRAVGDFFQVKSILDCTGIPFNGCRAKGERRA